MCIPRKLLHMSSDCSKLIYYLLGPDMQFQFRLSNDQIGCLAVMPIKEKNHKIQYNTRYTSSNNVGLTLKPSV